MAEAKQRQVAEQLSSSHGSFELVMSPLLLGLAGFWLDSKLGTTPWITIGATLFGIVGAATKLYLHYKATMSVHADELVEGHAERTEVQRAERAEAEAARAQLEADLEAELAEVAGATQ